MRLFIDWLMMMLVWSWLAACVLQLALIVDFAIDVGSWFGGPRTDCFALDARVHCYFTPHCMRDLYTAHAKTVFLHVALI